MNDIIKIIKSLEVLGVVIDGITEIVKDEIKKTRRQIYWNFVSTLAPSLVQGSKFVLAIGKCRGFCRGISIFFSICLGKRNAEAIKFLGILLKNTFPKKNIFFCLKRKKNVLLNKKVILVFHTIFKFDFITQIIYCILFSYFYCSLISGKRNIGTMLTLLYL